MDVEICTAQVENHPNADRLDIAIIGGYRAVIGKDSVEDGGLVAYIPEAAIIPDWLLDDLGLTGRLSGGKKNRVKAAKLRGVVSQGIVVPVVDGYLYGREVKEGDEVSEILGIEKYEPPIPTNMSGQVDNVMGKTLKFGIENIKKYQDIFVDGEPIVLTEKLHGTWCCFGKYLSPTANREESEWIVTSKGLSGRGMAFKLSEENENNLYVRMFNQLQPQIKHLEDFLRFRCRSWYLLGEIFGAKIQDLHYGEQKPTFAVFDLYTDDPIEKEIGYTQIQNDYGYLLRWLESKFGFNHVPILYEGPYSRELLIGSVVDRRLGKPKICSGDKGMREGSVIRPKEERQHPAIGRVILKSISEKYLLRKNGTELN